jgi:hypothetical protein
MKWNTDFKKWWSVKVFSQYFYGQAEKKMNILFIIVSLLIEFGLVAINFQMYSVVTVQSMVL